MGPYDDPANLNRSPKIESDVEVFDCEDSDCDDSDDELARLNDTLKAGNEQNEKKFEKRDCLQASGSENEDEIDNLFKLSVLFVRGNPFDSLKHWRMRCRFLDANLRIGSLGRIREVDEEFLSISERENDLSLSRPLSRRGVRLIQVQPRKNEVLQEIFEVDDVENSELPKECSTEIQCCNDSSDDLRSFSDDLESTIENNLPKVIASQVVVDDCGQFKSDTNKSVTSLTDAIHQPDERKTFTENSCSNAEEFLNLSQSNEQIPDLPVTNESPTLIQTAVSENPGFFAKTLRRIMAFFQTRKIDVWPEQISQSFV